MSTSNELKTEKVIHKIVVITVSSGSGPSYSKYEYQRLEILHPQQFMTPHVFRITTSPENVNNDSPWHAEAVLSLDNACRLFLTIYVPNRQQIPLSWTVVVKFYTIQFVSPREAYHNGAYNQDQQTNKIIFENIGEVNLATSDCIAIFGQTEYSNAMQYVNNNVGRPLKISFSLQTWITKPVSPLETRVVTFEQYGFQALTDFESLLKDTATADIEIKVTLGTQKSFHCHKSILAARSPILRAMFESPLREARDKVLIVEDLSADTIEHFLSFLYCGRFQNESWIKFLPHLTYAADKYCVKSLKDLCDSNLIRSVTCHNALAIANLAQRHQLTKAEKDIRTFIKKNAEKLNLDIAAATQELDIVE